MQLHLLKSWLLDLALDEFVWFIGTDHASVALPRNVVTANHCRSVHVYARQGEEENVQHRLRGSGHIELLLSVCPD